MRKYNRVVTILSVMLCILLMSSISVKAEEYTLEDMKEYIISEMQNFTTGIDVTHFGDARIFKSKEDIILFMKDCKANVIWTGDTPLFYSDYSEETEEYTLNVVRPRYVCTEQNSEKAVKAADKLLEGIKGNNNLTDAQKALLLHDRLIVSCEYDERYYKDPNRMPAMSHSGYGVFTNHIAVCDGYTAAYKYLLEQAGIKAEVCVSEELLHSWNIVYIDDVPYHVDVTWDDPMADTEGFVSHNNFLVSSEFLYRTGHTADDYYTFPEDTTYDNYFWQKSNAEFQLLDDKIYYINNSKETLNEWSGDTHTKLCSVADNWGSLKLANYNFSMLSNDGKKLLYSLTDAIYSYDIDTKVNEEVYRPEECADGTSNEKIYGFTYSDGEFICDISDVALIYGWAKYQTRLPIIRGVFLGIIVLIVIIVLIIIKIVKKKKRKKKALVTNALSKEKASEKAVNEMQE